MNALLQAAVEIPHFLQNTGEQFGFIGGVALQRQRKRCWLDEDGEF